MKKLKLICQTCETSYFTNRLNMKYCSASCRNKNSRIKKHIKKNEYRKQMFADKRFTYNPKEDKFYITSMMKQNTDDEELNILTQAT